MNFDTPSTKELIRDIGAMRDAALTLMNQGKSYDDLLKSLLKTNYFYEEDSPIPKMEHLTAITGWKYDKIRKELTKIYEDLKEGGYNGILFKIKKVKYFFYISSYDDRKLTIQFEDIKHLPVVGDTINVPFFRSYIGDYFHVEKIDHRFEGSTQEITLWLKPGVYNQFTAFKKDQDYAEGIIDFYEYHNYKKPNRKKRK